MLYCSVGELNQLFSYWFLTQTLYNFLAGPISIIWSVLWNPSWTGVSCFFLLFLNNALEKMQLKHKHFWHFVYQKTVPGLKHFLNVFSYMFKGQCVLKSKMLSNPMWDYTCDFFWEEWWKRWTSASVYSKAEDISTWECLRRLNEDVKVSNGQRETGSAWVQCVAGAVEVGSVSSGLAQASLVCLMCHYEWLAPGAALQLSHSIISAADSQTHTAHTHTA